MKLKNKKTGQIVEAEGSLYYEEKDGQSCVKDCFESLAELNEEWEDYEEPDERWYINEENEPQRVGFGYPIEDIENLEELGLLFKTEEEAEKAVEKLKAWKRLKDKGLFLKLDIPRGCIDYRIDLTPFRDEEIRGIAEDLELLF